MDSAVERRCHLLIGASLILLTVGIGYCVIVGTCLADFVVVIVGLLLGWISFFYCLGNASFLD